MKKHLLLFVLLGALKAYSMTSFDAKESEAIAKKFMEALTPEQKSKGCFRWSDSLRTVWHNLPMVDFDRKGLWLKDMTEPQRVLVHELLHSVLSAQGYNKALLIMHSDQALLERLTAAKNPIYVKYGEEKYFMSIFGVPGQGDWSWRFEGHHLSLNFTYTAKGVSCTPMFIGINPALTEKGMRAGQFALWEENEYGARLFNSLNPAMKKKALVGALPHDIDALVRTGKEAFLTKKEGVGYGEMGLRQKGLVDMIADAWMGNLNKALYTEQKRAFDLHKAALRFVWLGTENTNELHYFRLQTDTFAIEFADRDQGIYHYHTLWRNTENDFK